MNQIIINTNFIFIANNLESFLKNYFNISIRKVSNLSTIKLSDLRQDDTLIVLKEEDKLDIALLKHLKCKIILLTSNNIKKYNEIRSITEDILTFPIFLPDLLEKLNKNIK